MKITKYRNTGVALGLCAILAGCGGAGDESGEFEPTAGSELPEEANSSEPSVEVNPDFVTELASVQITETHRVDFFEVGRGNLLVQEDRHADLDGEATTDNFDASTDSPVALYLELMGDEADPAAVERLASFEERFAEAQAARAAQGDTASAPSEISPMETGDTILKDHSIGAAPPGWDWENDQRWFFENFCTLDGLHTCNANLGAFEWTVQASSGRVNFFNQDFSDSATFRLSYDPCPFRNWWEKLTSVCTTPFQRLLTLRPQPRHVVSNNWSMGSTRYSVHATGGLFGITLNFF